MEETVRKEISKEAPAMVWAREDGSLTKAGWQERTCPIAT